MKSDNTLVIDVETTTFNRGNPFDPRNKLVSYAYAISPDFRPVFKYHTDPDFISVLRDNVQHASVIIGCNVKFDIHWITTVGITLRPDQRVWDCLIAEFILGGQQQAMLSLNDSLESYGLPIKKDAVKEYWDAGIATEEIPVPVLEEYNIWDVVVTKMLYDTQQEFLSDKQRKLIFLEGEDLKTLQHAEYQGVKFDREQADKLLEGTKEQIAALELQLSQYIPTLPPGVSFNFDSGDQLSALLYGGTIDYNWYISEQDVYKTGAKKGQAYEKKSWSRTTVSFERRFKPLEGTEVAKTVHNGIQDPHFYQTDGPTLKQLKAKRKEDRQLLGALHERAEKIKVVEMVESVINKIHTMNWQDNLIHGQFNQNVARTGRLSSSAPNMQNPPPELDKLLVSRYD